MAASDEQFTFFWNQKSPFSQFYPAKFTINNIQYSCAEQYMMHQKAVLFGDEEMAEKILKSDQPRQQKAFGRRVENYDEDEWNKRCCDIVKDGNRAKFGQNPELKKLLLATEGSTLVEASPFDKKWGIALRADDRRARKRETWRGQNLLGECITEVRDKFLQEESGSA